MSLLSIDTLSSNLIHELKEALRREDELKVVNLNLETKLKNNNTATDFISYIKKINPNKFFTDTTDFINGPLRYIFSKYGHQAKFISTDNIEITFGYIHGYVPMLMV